MVHENKDWCGVLDCTTSYGRDGPTNIILRPNLHCFSQVAGMHEAVVVHSVEHLVAARKWSYESILGMSAVVR